MKEKIKKPKTKDIALFAKEWSALLNAGIPATDGLRLLSKRENRQFITKALKKTEEGHTPAQSFTETALLPPFFCALLRIGELAGTLPNELELAFRYYEQEQEIREKIKTASYYPVGLFIFLIFITLFFLFFVIPSFAELLKETDIPLPLITEIILSIALFLKAHGILVLLMLLIGMTATTWYFKKDGGKNRDNLLFKSKIMKKLYLIRFQLALSSLLDSGIALTEALDEVAGVVGNRNARRCIMHFSKELRNGRDFDKTLQDNIWTKDDMAGIVEIGMKSGQLAYFLRYNGERLMKEQSENLKRLQKLIEPAMIIIIGLMTAALLFSMLIPVFQAVGNIQ